MSVANKVLKEAFERERKQKEFWGKVTIQSGAKDNKAEVDAIVELLNQSEDKPSNYLKKEEYEFVSLFLDCKFFARKICDGFLKEITEKTQREPWKVFINNNLDVIVFYAVLKFQNPLKDKIKNFQRFAMLYKHNNAPDDDGFKIPYCFFEATEVFAGILEGYLLLPSLKLLWRT